MESNISYYKCEICQKEIDNRNKLLHIQFCKDIMQNELQEELDELKIENKIISKDMSEIIPNYMINIDANYPCLEELSVHNPKVGENYILCKYCNSYFNELEISDHIMCHNLENSELGLNPIRESEVDKDNNNNSKDDSYDMLDDVEDVRREIEEDEAFKRKFESKKQEHVGVKKKKNVILKVVDYLFDSSGRRYPPIVRIVGSIFDRRQLIALAAEEMAFRVIEHVQTRVNPNPNLNDDQILLDMIPEVEMKDINKLPEDKKDCIICLCPFENRDNIINLPCLHIYHSKCIKDWFVNNSTCPICKYKITNENFK